MLIYHQDFYMQIPIVIYKHTYFRNLPKCAQNYHAIPLCAVSVKYKYHTNQASSNISMCEIATKYKQAIGIPPRIRTDLQHNFPLCASLKVKYYKSSDQQYIKMIRHIEASSLM